MWLIVKHKNAAFMARYNVYVTVFWKTNRIDTNTEILFFPVDKSHTHALFRDTKHLRLDGLLQAAFFRRCQATRVPFLASVTPEGH